MKRGAPRHPKVSDLASRLKIPKYGAVGILEMLWHFASEYALPGDIGRFTDDAIATAVCWDDPSIILVSALVQARWLDCCSCHRLRIHDWPDHADQTVQRVLATRHQEFLSCYDDPSTMLASSQYETSCLKPIPTPIPKAKPIPPPPVELPVSLKTEEFEKVWDEWLKYRRSKGKVKDFDTMFRKQLEMLSGIGVAQATQTLNISMMNGWTGLFPDRVRPVVGTHVAHTGSPAGLLMAITAKIKALEEQRRDARDFAFTDEGKAKLQAIEDQIKAERAKLSTIPT